VVDEDKRFDLEEGQPMSQTSSPERGRYLYCIIRAGTTDGLDLRGIDDQPISVVADDDLGVLVSPSAVKRYRLSRQYTLGHELIIERAMARGTVLPIKFGTVAETEDAIREKVLQARGEDLHQLMAAMDGKVELGLKVVWNQERIYADIVARNADIRSLRDQLAGRPPNEGHYERVRLGEMVEEALTDRRLEDADAIMTRLEPLAVDTRRNDIYGEMMILNAAFLVDKTREAEFDAEIQALDNEMNNLMTFKYIGPLPPFNFVDLVISWS
jgi:hypothetical protein